jgi:hypothetical protein
MVSTSGPAALRAHGNLFFMAKISNIDQFMVTIRASTVITDAAAGPQAM